MDDTARARAIHPADEAALDELREAVRREVRDTLRLILRDLRDGRTPRLPEAPRRPA